MIYFEEGVVNIFERNAISKQFFLKENVLLTKKPQ